MARAGLAARAVVWAVLAYLTLDIAVSGAPGKSASAGGALQQVAREPADQAVLVVLAAGMIAYAAWRLLQAVAGSVGAENAVVRLFQRIGLVAAGVVYVALCVQALRLVVRGPTSPQSNHSSASLSAVVLGWPGGQELLAAIGLGIVIGSLIFTGWAAFQGFTGGLRMRAMPGSVSAFARVVGTAGQMMRGLVFIAVGTYVLIAAIRDAPGQTKGLDMTLRALDAKPYGSWLLVLAGAGFLAFALFSLVEVPYGRA
ncbi:MAG: DUF1206 domain-containing protein [Acidimicrobiales bacterium]